MSKLNDILNASRRTKPYDIDGIGVTVRELSTRELADIASKYEGKELEQLAAVAAVATLDDNGDVVFGGAEDTLELPLRHVRAIGEMAMELSGIGAGNDPKPKRRK